MPPDDKKIPKSTAVPPPVATIIVEWESKVKALQTPPLTGKASGDSFMLVSPGVNPVALGWVKPADVPKWDTAATVSITVTRKGNELKVSAPLDPPAGSSHLRLDFELKATAKGSTATVLSFRQLFEADANGISKAVSCAVENATLSASSTTVTENKAPSRRRFDGLHPLLSFVKFKVTINAEFVDLTLLWWSIRADKLGWYLNPVLGGRPTKLRVLGWTAGGSPMIWFAVIPDAAEKSLPGGSGSAADLVFFRPPPGINAFFYTPDEKGLANARHDGTTLEILARYLLSPIPSTSFPAIQKAGSVKEAERMADQIQPGGTPPGSPVPADPMDTASGFPVSFRPVGLEAAFNRAGGNRVLFLPLAAGDVNHTYEGVVRAGLQARIQSALGVLWNANAIDNSGTSIPDLSKRELWLAGHSAGNLSMWACAQRNAAEVDRMITFDASPWQGKPPQPDNLKAGVVIIKIVSDTRKKAGKSLTVFAIVSPNLGQNKGVPVSSPFQGLDDDTDLRLRRTGAIISVLPEFSQRVSYWTPVPVSTPKTFLQYVLSNWSDALLAASAKNPARWRFLFFHEMAVYGADLIQPPAGSPPGTAPTLRTFFEQALGAPNPRPAPPP